MRKFTEINMNLMSSQIYLFILKIFPYLALFRIAVNIFKMILKYFLFEKSLN